MDQSTVDLVVGLAQAFAWPAVVLGLVAILRRPIVGLIETLRARPFDVSAGPFALQVEEAAVALESAVEHAGHTRDVASARKALPSDERTFAELTGRRVLWVDDNPAGNRDLIRVLDLLGVNVQIARSTQEALRAVDRSIFDAVVTDLVRSADSEAGIGLIRELRQCGFDAPVYVYISRLDHDMGVPDGADGITNRPDDLIAHLVRVLSR